MKVGVSDEDLACCFEAQKELSTRHLGGIDTGCEAVGSGRDGTRLSRYRNNKAPSSMQGWSRHSSRTALEKKSRLQSPSFQDLSCVHLHAFSPSPGWRPCLSTGRHSRSGSCHPVLIGPALRLPPKCPLRAFRWTTQSQTALPHAAIVLPEQWSGYQPVSSLADSRCLIGGGRARCWTPPPLGRPGTSCF